MKTYADMLRSGASAAEQLLSIGRAIGFGRAQQILGEQWEAEHDCAPRGRMGVSVKDAPDILDALYEALEFAEDQEDVIDGPDGEPAPNKAMHLAQTLRAAIARATGEQQ